MSHFLSNFLSLLCILLKYAFVKYIICMKIKMKQNENGTTFSTTLVLEQGKTSSSLDLQSLDIQLRSKFSSKYSLTKKKLAKNISFFFQIYNLKTIF